MEHILYHLCLNTVSKLRLRFHVQILAGYGDLRPDLCPLLAQNSASVLIFRWDWTLAMPCTGKWPQSGLNLVGETNRCEKVALRRCVALYVLCTFTFTCKRQMSRAASRSGISVAFLQRSYFHLRYNCCIALQQKGGPNITIAANITAIWRFEKQLIWAIVIELLFCYLPAVCCL